MKTTTPNPEVKKENQPASKPKGHRPSVADQWRVLVARIQCAWLVFSYKKKESSKETGAIILEGFFSAHSLRFFGELLYLLGFQLEYKTLRLYRFMRKVVAFFIRVVVAKILSVAKLIYGVLHTIWMELFRPFYVFFRGIYRLFAHGAKVCRERNIFVAIWACICYLFRGLFLYVRLIPGMVSYALPFIALFFCGTYMQEIMSQEYVLAVQVNGVTVGYVESEMVFESAKEDVQARVDYAGTGISETTSAFDVTPTYILSIAVDTLDESEMADAILEAASDEISEGTALYIDGDLRAITQEGEDLEAFLTSLTEPYIDESDDTLQVVFNKDIELVEGVYFTESFTSASLIIDYLSGLEEAQVNYTVVSGDSWSLIASKNGLTQDQLFAMNPDTSSSTSIFPGDTIIVGLEKSVLEVWIIRQEEYDEAIAYSTVTSTSSDYAFGSTTVTQNGVDGSRHITAQITYDVNGNVLDTEIISNVVTLEPVDKITVQGTKLSSGMIAEVGTGSFLWPVPNYTYCSRWAFSGHNGVDICGAYGTAIYASDAGVVTKSGWNAAGSGYGYSVVIDHGNGYTTLYAHMSTISVSVGDVVTQGQYIAAMGSTGNSTGNHLHFEIKLNGVVQYPQNFFTAYYR